MKQHGFARRCDVRRWSRRAADRAVFALTDSDADARRIYPFAFRLEVAFALDGRDAGDRRDDRQPRRRAAARELRLPPRLRLAAALRRARAATTASSSRPTSRDAIKRARRRRHDRRRAPVAAGRAATLHAHRRAVRATTRWSGTRSPVAARHLRRGRPARSCEIAFPDTPIARHLDQARRALRLHRAVARHRRSRRLSRASSATSRACSRSPPGGEKRIGMSVTLVA